jgi:hypothetical protein
VVKHFVAPVTYTVLDFVDRNSEGVHKTYANLRLLLEGSTLGLFAHALALPETKRLGDRHMGERVVAQTQALQVLLDASERNHFVLCLRSSSVPSAATPPGAYEEALIERQVQHFKVRAVRCIACWACVLLPLWGLRLSPRGTCMPR